MEQQIQSMVSALKLSHSPVLSDIVHHRVVHLILLHEDVSLQYFIPAVA